MKRENQLNKLADEYMREHENERASVEAEARKLRAKLGTLEAKLTRLKDLATRRRAYDPETDQIPNCPYCSIDKGRSVPLVPQSNQTPKMDEWLCRVCGE